MKPVYKKLYFGVLTAAVGSLLSACDGRGVTHFEPIKYTPEQIAANNAKLNGGATPQGSTTFTTSTGSGPGPAFPKSATGAGQPSSIQPSQTVASSASATDAPDRTGTVKSTDVNPDIPESDLFTSEKLAEDPRTDKSPQAKSKFYNETADGEPKFAKRQDLLEVASDALNTERTDERLSQLIRGITPRLSVVGGSVVLSVDAVVMIAGEARLLYLKNVPMNMSNKQDLVDTLHPTFKKGLYDETPVTISNRLLYVIGFCTDDKCSSVLLMMQFGLPKQSRPLAVFRLDPANGGKIAQHNLPEKPKEFCEAIGGDKRACKDTESTEASVNAPAVKPEEAPKASRTRSLAPVPAAEPSQTAKTPQESAQPFVLDSANQSPVLNYLATKESRQKIEADKAVNLLELSSETTRKAISEKFAPIVQKPAELGPKSLNDK